jgi:hypothetical protein
MQHASLARVFFVLGLAFQKSIDSNLFLLFDTAGKWEAAAIINQ